LLLSCITREADKLFSQAKSQWKSGAYTESVNTFQRFISSYPENPHLSEVYYRLGDIYYLYLENNREAIRYYRHVFKYDKKNKYIYDAQWKIAGIYMEELQDYNNAIVEYKRFIEINNDARDIDAQMNIAECYTNLKFFSQAITEYELILKNFSDYQYTDRINFCLGNLYFLENKFDEAINYYLRVIEETSDQRTRIKSKFSLADCYYKKGELKEALDIYKYLYNENDKYKIILKKKIDDIKKNLY